MTVRNILDQSYTFATFAVQTHFARKHLVSILASVVGEHHVEMDCLLTLIARICIDLPNEASARRRRRWARSRCLLVQSRHQKVCLESVFPLS